MGGHVQRIDLGGAGQALMQKRRFALLGDIGFVWRGPFWREGPDPARLAKALRSFGHPVVINAEASDARKWRCAGFLPLMTPATVAMLDAAETGAQFEARLDRKFRNRVRHARASLLRVVRNPLPDEPGHWLLSAEDTQRRERGYQGLPPALALAYTRVNPGQAQLFEARLSGKPVAGMLFLRHGTMASCFIGCTTQAGRAMNAHNLLLVEAVEWLRARGVETVDLGALDTVNAPGLARFKLSAGARAVTLGGTWLYARWLAPIARHL